MADRHTDSGREPSLELPSFGLRRRKKRPATEPAPAETHDAPEPAISEPAATEPDAAEPRDTAPTEVREPAREPVPVREPAPAPAPPAASAPAETTAFAAAPPDDEVAEQPVAEHGTTEPGTTAPSTTEPGTTEPGSPRRRRGVRPPAVAGPVAAVVTGAVVGLLAVGLTFAALQGCEAVRGTSSCGGGPGFFLLLAVLVLLTYVGSWLLGAAGVRDPGSTSFLAVGLLAVIAMLFLVDVLMSPWMALVMPLVAAATFGLSHQVTTAVVEEE